MGLGGGSFLLALKNVWLDQLSFRTARDYAALNMNNVKKIQDIHFLNRCKRNSIIPNFIKNKKQVSPELLKNKKVSRRYNNLTLSILHKTLREHHKDLCILRNKITNKQNEMDKLCSEDKATINKHLTKSLDKLKRDS